MRQMNNEKLSYYGILGVCYYPEVWPEKMWRDDLKLMYDTGIRLIRIAEFAWGIIEPREGEYHFELFDKIISICEEIGIKVLMCTPTAAVPAWIPQKYPEVMKWNIQRQPLKYGSRKDLCYSSRAFLKLCDNVVKQLGKHYAKSPSVIGWQIDNEINCGSHTSYSPEDRRHFIVFLKEKYKTLDALNAAWGTNFWSQQYSEWEQVDLPGETAEAGNPSQLLDEKYFINWQVNYFASRQVKILKSINSEWIITHNGAFPNVNLEQFRKHFDVFGYDQYPSFYHCWQDATINLSKIRGHSNRFWILEQVSGPGGKLNFLHPTPEPGQIRLWTWESIAHGADLISYFQWRTHPFGTEQRWHGILDQDNKQNRRLKEINVIANELQNIPKEYWNSNHIKEVAIIHDFVNMIGDEIFTDVKSSNIRCTYRSLLNKGIMVDIIPNNSELRDYSLAIDLHPRITDEKHVRHLEEYVKSGGNLLIGSGAGLRDLNGHMRQETLPGPYSRLAGLNISEWTTLPKGKDKTSICYKNKVIPIESFAETLKPIDAQMLAYYDSTNPLLKKKPAICINQFGKGKVIYFGSYFADNSDVFVSLMIKWLKIACLSNVPSGIEILRRESKKYRWITLLNHNREAVDILLPEDMKKKIDLILLDLNQNNDSFQLPGYGVGIIVIKNEKFA